MPPGDVTTRARLQHGNMQPALNVTVARQAARTALCMFNPDNIVYGLLRLDNIWQVQPSVQQQPCLTFFTFCLTTSARANLLYPSTLHVFLSDNIPFCFKLFFLEQSMCSTCSTFNSALRNAVSPSILHVRDRYQPTC